jgi:hypothetical protein
MTSPDDPEVLRKEILLMLNKVSDRGSLLFFLWLLRRFHANAPPIPGNDELRALHEAFIRMDAAFRAKKTPPPEDVRLVGKWTDGDEASMARALGKAVKFFREQRGMSRLTLSKKTRLPLRTILAIERGKVFDIPLPMLLNLTRALGTMPSAFTDKLLDSERGNNG